MSKGKKQNKLNILGVLPHSIGGRLTISSVLDGLEQNGHYVMRYDELYDKKERLFKILNSNNFDFVAGYDFSGLKLKIENNIDAKVINYFSDEIDKPAAGAGYKELYKNLNDEGVYTFYWDLELTQKEQKTIKNIFYMPHFVNEKIYTPQNSVGGGAFAGRLDTDFRLNLWIDTVKSLPNVDFSWYAIEKHYNDALLRADKEGKEVLKNTYRGFLSTEQEMATALNKSQIVLNMHSQGIGSFNYRTFQALACGKVVLSDRRSEAERLFKNNEVIFYEDAKDLRNKISYWLTHFDEYKKQAEIARDCIVQNFNARTCTAEMLDIIFKCENTYKSN